MTAWMLLGPATPMLFQGQEFAASSPFLFFADHNAELEKAGLGRVQLASPFLTTIPGTDTYTDQLW